MKYDTREEPDFGLSVDKKHAAFLAGTTVKPLVTAKLDGAGNIVGLEADGQDVAAGGGTGTVTQEQLDALGYAKNTPGGVAGIGENNQIIANIVPRNNTLAALSALTSGGNEIAVATDEDAIVVLKGEAGTGTATVYAPIPVGMVELDAEGPGNHVLNVTKIVGQSGLYLESPGSVSITSGPGASIDLIPAAGTAVVMWNSDQSSFAVLVDDNSAVMADIQSGNQVIVDANGISFFDVGGGVPKPTVTGSRGGNAALASLLTALASLGLINDSTTA